MVGDIQETTRLDAARGYLTNAPAATAQTQTGGLVLNIAECLIELLLANVLGAFEFRPMEVGSLEIRHHEIGAFEIRTTGRLAASRGAPP